MPPDHLAGRLPPLRQEPVLGSAIATPKALRLCTTALGGSATASCVLSLCFVIVHHAADPVIVDV